MRLVKIVISVALIALTAFAWVTIGGSAANDSSEYQKLIAHADKSMKAELYEDAYLHYSEAFDIKPSEDLAVKMVDACTCSYQEEEEGSYSARQTLIGTVDKARTAYPAHISFPVQEIALYMEEQDYKNAKRVCQQAMDENKTDEQLNAAWQELICSRTKEYIYYVAYSEPASDYFAVCDGLQWWWTSVDGKRKSSYEYAMMGPVGQEGLFLARREGKSTRFYDLNGVARGRVNLEVLQAGVYQEGLCPVELQQNQWYYINLDGEKVSGPYRQAGCYLNGKAAVQRQDGKWRLIDINGEDVSGPFTDIKLGLSGACECAGVMLAAQKAGEYHIFDMDGNPVSEFTCQEMDIPTEDGQFAFKKGGKWGFVDCEGTVILEPKFQQARSFSNGLAAVCEGGRWDYIRMDGKKVTEDRLLDAGYVSNAGSSFISDEDGFFRMMQFVFFQELVS